MKRRVSFFDSLAERFTGIGWWVLYLALLSIICYVIIVVLASGRGQLDAREVIADFPQAFLLILALFPSALAMLAFPDAFRFSVDDFSKSANLAIGISIAVYGLFIASLYYGKRRLPRYRELIIFWLIFFLASAAACSTYVARIP